MGLCQQDAAQDTSSTQLRGFTALSLLKSVLAASVVVAPVIVAGLLLRETSSLLKFTAAKNDPETTPADTYMKNGTHSSTCGG